MNKINLVILLITLNFLYACNDIRSESFESDINALKNKGWFIPTNASIDSNYALSGSNSIKISVSPQSESKYVSTFIPVEPQKKYIAEVWIKYKNIKKNNSLKYNRGAVLFCQFHDINKKWISGGTFPLGFFGDGGWQKNRFLLKNRIPQNVKYIKILLGVEGQGIAWFDDFRFEKYKNNNKKIAILKNEDYNSLKKNKTLMLNGRPFFPIGCYRDPDDKLLNVSNINNIGFNLTHSYDFEHGSAGIEKAKQYLELCENNNLKVFMGINREKIKEKDLQWISSWINKLKDYPALFSWYLYDEPEIHGISTDFLQRLNGLAGCIDSSNYTSIVLTNPRKSKQYYNSYELLMIDEYPLPNRNIDTVFRKLKKATYTINGLKPIIAVLQSHDKKGKEKIISGKEIVHPTYNEIRCMTFLALASGVDGIIYYWSPNNKYHIINQSPKVWKGLKRVIKELNEIKPFLLSDSKVYYKFDKLCNLRAWSSNFNGKKLFAIINASKNSFEIDIDMSEVDFSKPLNNSNNLFINFDEKNRRLKCSFIPYEVKIFYLL